MQHGPSTGMFHRSLVLLCWLSWGCPAESWAELWLPACRLCHTCLINPPECVQMLSWLLFYCSFSFQPTKIFNYMKWKKTCDSLFMIFSAVFLISRLVIYPYTWVCCSEGTWKSCLLRDRMISWVLQPLFSGRGACVPDFLHRLKCHVVIAPALGVNKGALPRSS